MSSAPTLAKDGIVIMKVLKIILRLFAFFTSLKILPILKARIRVVYGPTLTDVVFVSRIPRNVPITMMKSKTFHPLSK
jgi:hypothetical protein